MKLEHQKRGQHDELKDARERLQDGVAPTEDAVRNPRMPHARSREDNVQANKPN